jgi:putative FmdB family regulatory protein
MYDFKCDNCGHVTPVVVPIARRNETFPCEHCGTGTFRRVEVCAVRISKDYEGYVSPASGRWVEGRKQHIEDLRRTGCRLYEPGETEAFIREKDKRRDAAWQKAVDSAVGAAAQELGLGG